MSGEFQSYHDALVHAYRQGVVNTLKSLRPKPKVDSVEYERGFLAGQGSIQHWKPSKEQMEALKDVQLFFTNEVWKQEKADTIRSLYNDLKKL